MMKPCRPGRSDHAFHIDRSLGGDGAERCRYCHECPEDLWPDEDTVEFEVDSDPGDENDG